MRCFMRFFGRISIQCLMVASFQSTDDAFTPSCSWKIDWNIQFPICVTQRRCVFHTHRIFGVPNTHQRASHNFPNFSSTQTRFGTLPLTHLFAINLIYSNFHITFKRHTLKVFEWSMWRLPLLTRLTRSHLAPSSPKYPTRTRLFAEKPHRFLLSPIARPLSPDGVKFTVRHKDSLFDLTSYVTRMKLSLISLRTL